MPVQSRKDVGAALKKGALAPAYYLFGAEDVLKEEIVRGVIDRAVDPSIRDFNFDQVSATSLDPEMIEALCNTLPMMAGNGPFGPIEMGGMFTVVKVRDALSSYDQDPGWYQHPEGTRAKKVTLK